MMHLNKQWVLSVFGPLLRADLRPRYTAWAGDWDLEFIRVACLRNMMA